LKNLSDFNGQIFINLKLPATPEGK
jgi:hypothetical protein